MIPCKWKWKFMLMEHTTECVAMWYLGSNGHSVVFFCRFFKFYFICSFVYDVLVWKLFIFGTAKRIPQKYLYNISKTILYTFTKVLQYGIIIMLSFERVNLNKSFNHNHCNLQIYLSVIIFAVSLEDFLKVNFFENLVYRHESKIFLK